MPVIIASFNVVWVMESGRIVAKSTLKFTTINHKTANEAQKMDLAVEKADDRIVTVRNFVRDVGVNRSVDRVHATKAVNH